MKFHILKKWRTEINLAVRTYTDNFTTPLLARLLQLSTCNRKPNSPSHPTLVLLLHHTMLSPQLDLPQILTCHWNGLNLALQTWIDRAPVNKPVSLKRLLCRAENFRDLYYNTVNHSQLYCILFIKTLHTVVESFS